MIRLALGLALVLATAAPAWADDAPPPAPVRPACEACPPDECECYPPCECRDTPAPKCPAAYKGLRWAEDWKPCLCVPYCDRGDWTDNLKAIRLAACPLIRLDVGGQIRFRAEYFQNWNLRDGSDFDDGWVLARFRAHADLYVTDHFRLFIEGIYADQWEREVGPRGVDVIEGDLLNGFVEVRANPGAWKTGAWAGRHELQFAEQVLISALDWANTRRTFQGAGAWATRRHHRIDAFWTRPVTASRGDRYDVIDDESFFGAYYANQVWNCVTWDAYLLGLHRDSATYIDVTGDEQRYTVGVRGDGEIPGTRFDWAFEGGYQFGSFGGDRISAWFGLAEFGWKPCTHCWDPHLLIGLDYASGDRDPDDSTQGTFNQLFPLVHKYLGIADLFARQNIAAARLQLRVKPTKKLTVHTHLLGFWRASSDDNVYSVTGGVLRAGAGTNKRALGTELDLVLQYKFDRHWAAFGGYAHFFAGQFFSDTGADNDVNFFYLGAQVTF